MMAHNCMALHHATSERTLGWYRHNNMHALGIHSTGSLSFANGRDYLRCKTLDSLELLLAPARLYSRAESASSRCRPLSATAVCMAAALCLSPAANLTRSSVRASYIATCITCQPGSRAPQVSRAFWNAACSETYCMQCPAQDDAVGRRPDCTWT